MILDMYSDPDCFSIMAQSLSEEGVEVEVGESLLKNGELDDDGIIILRPDEWYSTYRMARPPKAVDGVIFVSDEDRFHMYVIELKSSRFPDLNKKHIQEKFNTVFERFLVEDFQRFFDDPSRPYSLHTLKLWLVCDPLRLRNKAVDMEDFVRLATASKAKMRTLMANYALGFKPLAFKGLRVQIMPMLSPPVIERTHFVDRLE